MMISVEKQKELLINARKNKNVSLEKIKAADLFYEEDRIDFINLINENDFDYAWNYYANLDTAAREDFMDLLEMDLAVLKFNKKLFKKEVD